MKIVRIDLKTCNLYEDLNQDILEWQNRNVGTDLDDDYQHHYVVISTICIWVSLFLLLHAIKYVDDLVALQGRKVVSWNIMVVHEPCNPKCILNPGLRIWMTGCFLE